jgi:hypothetical protein
MVRKVDSVNQALTLNGEDGDHVIPFADIYNIKDPACILFLRPGA